jgi:hypothetical protein
LFRTFSAGTDGAAGDPVRRFVLRWVPIRKHREKLSHSVSHTACTFPWLGRPRPRSLRPAQTPWARTPKPREASLPSCRFKALWTPTSMVAAMPPWAVLRRTFSPNMLPRIHAVSIYTNLRHLRASSSLNAATPRWAVARRDLSPKLVTTHSFGAHGRDSAATLVKRRAGYRNCRRIHLARHPQRSEGSLCCQAMAPTRSFAALRMTVRGYLEYLERPYRWAVVRRTFSPGIARTTRRGVHLREPAVSAEEQRSGCGFRARRLTALPFVGFVSFVVKTLKISNEDRATNYRSVAPMTKRRHVAQASSPATLKIAGEDACATFPLVGAYSTSNEPTGAGVTL